MTVPSMHGWMHVCPVKGCATYHILPTWEMVRVSVGGIGIDGWVGIAFGVYELVGWFFGLLIESLQGVICW